MIRVIAISILLTGCSTLLPQKENEVENYVGHTFPIPEERMSKCVSGKIDHVLSGPGAITIQYINQTNQPQIIRLPHSSTVSVKVAANAFCYDYFNVD